MNPKQTVPLATTIAPVLAAAPPLLFFAGIGLTLYWLLSRDDKKKPDAPASPEQNKEASRAPASLRPASAPVFAQVAKPTPVSVAVAALTPKSSPAPAPSVQVASSKQLSSASQRRFISRRVTREDLAEALGYGARAVTRLEAVAALQALGFGKTAAYKALSEDGRFGTLFEHTPDGLIEWNG